MFKFIGIIFSKMTNIRFEPLNNTLINPLQASFNFLFRPRSGDDGMMKKVDEKKLFSKFNDGLLIDGKNKKLSSIESFNHLALISRTGGGKTSTYVLPNIYNLANEKCSMVITDLSGEIFNKTSGYLKQRGFNIYVLDPENLESSNRYNPLIYATNSIGIDLLSDILISSSGLKGEKAEDRIWSDGAKNIISILIRVLKGTNDLRYMNLANVRYLLNNFRIELDDEKKEPINEFVKRYADDKTFNEYQALIQGNEKTIQSFLSTANIALSSIGINENLEKLTFSHDIDFKKLRDEKSVVYIKIKENSQEQYSFLLNLFYSQLFNEMMKKLPSKKDLPIYCILDEFGNMKIPNFSTVITTVRKYKISLSIILQNLNQLDEKYTSLKAKTIFDGGIASKLILSGADLELASNLERMFGNKRVVEKDAQGQDYYEKVRVMDASEIITMQDNEALYVYANKKPLKLEIKPYYKDFTFNSYSKIKPYLFKNPNAYDYITYVDLENIEW